MDSFCTKRYFYIHEYMLMKHIFAPNKLVILFFPQSSRIFFFLIGNADVQRDRKIFCPHMTGLMSPSETRSQDLLAGLPYGCWGPRTWVILHCFFRPYVGSWIVNRAAVLWIGTCMGCGHKRWRLSLLCHSFSPHRLCNTLAHRQKPGEIIL